VATIRDATPADAEAVEALHDDGLGAVLEAAGLPAAHVATLRDLQARARTAGYATSYPDALDRVADAGSGPVGRALCALDAEGLVVVDVAVAAGHRRRGVGRALLADACERADRAGLAVHARIRPDNAASLALFAAAGFVVRRRDELDVVVERPSAASV